MREILSVQAIPFFFFFWTFNPIALRMAKMPNSFGHSKCNRVKAKLKSIVDFWISEKVQKIEINREKLGKSQGIIKWRLCGNPACDIWSDPSPYRYHLMIL